MRRALLPVLLLLGCGVRPTTASDAGTPLRAPGLTGVHLGTCDDPRCGNGMNPPLGGDHCGTTVPCRKYDVAQPRCSWLHNLEHGHAVLAFNCPSGCADLVAKLNGVFDARNSGRILVTPDPMQPKKLAALVWGFGWQGDDFDAAAIDAVLSHQDGEAPEPGLACTP